MPKPAPKPDDPVQSKRFLEIAGEFETESKPSDFERAFKKVATSKRASPPTPKRKKR